MVRASWARVSTPVQQSFRSVPLYPPAKLNLSTILSHRMTGMVINTKELVISQTLIQLARKASVKVRLLPFNSRLAINLQIETRCLTGSEFPTDFRHQETPNENL